MSVEKYKDILNIEIFDTTNNILKKNYEKIKFLGKGARGEIYKVKELATGKLYILKQIKNDGIKSDIDKECIIYKILGNSCENLMHLQKIFYGNGDDEGVLFYLFDDISECDVLCDEHDHDEENELRIKKDLVGKFDKLMLVILDVINGLEYIHSHNIIHNDLNGSNILVDQNNKGYIIDFGHSCSVDKLGYNEDVKYIGGYGVGTLGYSAPEILINSPTIDFSADIYSLGVIMYRLFYDELFLMSSINKLPKCREKCKLLSQQKRYHLGKNELIINITDNCPTYIYEINIEYVNLISSMMSYNPLDRPLLENIKKSINKMLLLYL